MSLFHKVDEAKLLEQYEVPYEFENVLLQEIVEKSDRWQPRRIPIDKAHLAGMIESKKQGVDFPPTIHIKKNSGGGTITLALSVAVSFNCGYSSSNSFRPCNVIASKCHSNRIRESADGGLDFCEW